MTSKNRNRLSVIINYFYAQPVFLNLCLTCSLKQALPFIVLTYHKRARSNKS
jgi:hypothetical protein